MKIIIIFLFFIMSFNSINAEVKLPKIYENGQCFAVQNMVEEALKEGVAGLLEKYSGFSADFIKWMNKWLEFNCMFQNIMTAQQQIMAGSWNVLAENGQQALDSAKKIDNSIKEIKKFDLSKENQAEKLQQMIDSLVKKPDKNKGETWIDTRLNSVSTDYGEIKKTVSSMNRILEEIKKYNKDVKKDDLPAIQLIAENNALIAINRTTVGNLEKEISKNMSDAEKINQKCIEEREKFLRENANLPEAKKKSEAEMLRCTETIHEIAQKISFLTDEKIKIAQLNISLLNAELLAKIYERLALNASIEKPFDGKTPEDFIKDRLEQSNLQLIK